MRLKKVKLAGFKSFVDPTHLELHSNLVAILGPNGCGKSNVIDAVRWVMGESSAKYLRGESMTDVIFNGSSSRKPVGQASIELLFDNSDGGLGGEYANYAEISVRREVNRDSQLSYYLNGTRCRRRDVTDIFLGTGLGPRSYAIIEQGMISRLIEAKAEDLRAFFEEAAGISLYKKRRHETEIRMRHTVENLTRLNDLRQEQDKQLERLKRQADAALKYKESRDAQTLIEARLEALRWQHLDEERALKTEQVRNHATELEARLAQKASTELELEKFREEHVDKIDHFNHVQTRFYELGAQLARLEQNLNHQKTRAREIQADIAQAETLHNTSQEQLEDDCQALIEFELQAEALQPSLELMQAELEEAEQSCEQARDELDQSRAGWEALNSQAASAEHSSFLQKSKIEHLDKLNSKLQQQLMRLKDEHALFDVSSLQSQCLDAEELAAEIDLQLETYQQADQSHRREIEQLKLDLTARQQAYHQSQQSLQSQLGRQASLQALQQAALGKTDETFTAWLQEQGLADKPRLGEKLEVDGPWQTAVELVLGHSMEAVCLNEGPRALALLADNSPGALTLLSQAPLTLAQSDLPCPSLASKLKLDWPVSALLGEVYVCQDLAEAQALQPDLLAHQSLITQDGYWLGANWLKTGSPQSAQSGILQREGELKALADTLAALQDELALQQAELDAGQNRVSSLEIERSQLQTQVQELHKRQSEQRALSARARSQMEHAQHRLAQIAKEQQELQQQSQEASEECASARGELQDSLQAMVEIEAMRQNLSQARQAAEQRYQVLQHAVRACQDNMHEQALQAQSYSTHIQATRQGIERLNKQQVQSSERLTRLKEMLNEVQAPQEELHQGLDELLTERLSQESEVSEARQALESFEQATRALEKARSQYEQEADLIRDKLDELKLKCQALEIRLQTVLEKIEASPYSLQQLLDELDRESDLAAMVAEVERLTNLIAKLGAINLAAIEEYQAEMERKVYLDSQFEDLSEALTTLENAIRKIDKETRARFKETFDKVNAEFKVLFPKLFGGGQAYLELLGEDLLEAGVTVMARPPGKRNSSIHLLSGGEKALTAVSLVFAIFKLNPAPFCILDEVDAPLDDANVGRFCELVKHMSETVQFIYITHNKLAMEMAQHLIGVTMKEPGVSRLVSVDVEEAVALIAS